MTLYVIFNRRTRKYWNVGACDLDDIAEATRFENSERSFVRLYRDEVWEKVT